MLDIRGKARCNSRDAKSALSDDQLGWLLVLVLAGVFHIRPRSTKNGAPQSSVVADQSQLAKFVQEKAHPGSGRSDHLRQGSLIDRSIDWDWLSIFSKLADHGRRRASRFSLELNSWSIKSSSMRLLRVTR